MNDALVTARDLAASLSARHRRWKKVLRSATILPGDPPRTGAAPTERDFIICGAPRSGTTLLAAVLVQPPRILTVNEPWDGMRLAPGDLFVSLRAELGQTGALRRGRLDLEALYADGRVQWCGDGEKPQLIPLSGPFHLGVKWPAFWRYLDYLPTTKFLVCLRDPVETIASSRKKGGELTQGLDYDIPFNREMNRSLRAATKDWAVRRVLMYDYIYERILPHLGRPNVLAVRYERWFEDRQGQISDISAFLGVDLGAGFPRIRPRRDHGPDPDLSVVRAHCKTAARLGYDT